MIETKLGLKSQLIKGSGGNFNVTVDNQLIFSKKVLGRFPDPGEIEAKLEAMM